ncbi:MAG: DNA circularization protein [Plesiomonas sp.]|uniref:DNA circularization protein n=1 Tax=Plesiomonas sp. TaxID=2486279 RepID=UPI003F3B8325
MSWQDNLQDASFKGIRFDVLRESATASRDHAMHEYPFVDGADVHDLGRKARNLRLTAVFWGEDYDTQLQNFMAVLDEAGSGELVHPIYGSIPKVQLIESQVSHDAEQPDYCTVTLVFLESITGTKTQSTVKPEQWGDALFNALDDLQDKVTSLYDAAMAPINKTKRLMAKGKTALSSMLNTLTIMRSGVNGVFTDAADYLKYPGRYVNDLRAVLDVRTMASVKMLDGLLNQREGITQTKTGAAIVRFTRQGGGTASNTALLHLISDKPSLNARYTPMSDPTALLSAWASDCDTLDTLINLSQSLITDSTSAVVPVPDTAKIEDVAEVNALHTCLAAMRASEILTDILTAPAAEALTPDHIEMMTNRVRQYIRKAMEANRETYHDYVPLISEDSQALGLRWSPVNESFKSVALALQCLAEQEITRHPPLIMRIVNQDTNLHLLAHAWYGDYRRAAELLRLNAGLTDPNSIKAGDCLNAYSR